MDETRIPKCASRDKNKRPLNLATGSYYTMNTLHLEQETLIARLIEAATSLAGIPMHCENTEGLFYRDEWNDLFLHLHMDANGAFFYSTRIREGYESERLLAKQAKLEQLLALVFRDSSLPFANFHFEA